MPFFFQSRRLNEKVWSYRLSVVTVQLILRLILYLLVVCYYLPHHDQTVRMVFGFYSIVHFLVLYIYLHLSSCDFEYAHQHYC